MSVGDARRIHPTLGPIAYDWRGTRVRRDSAPHALWLFSRAADCARSLDGAAKARLDALLARTGGTEAMGFRLARPMKRQDYALVLA